MANDRFGFALVPRAIVVFIRLVRVVVPPFTLQAGRPRTIGVVQIDAVVKRGGTETHGLTILTLLLGQPPVAGVENSTCVPAIDWIAGLFVTDAITIVVFADEFVSGKYVVHIRDNSVNVRIAGVADIILIDVFLKRIGRTLAVVAFIAYAIPVAVFLERVGGKGAVILVTVVPIIVDVFLDVFLVPGHPLPAGGTTHVPPSVDAITSTCDANQWWRLSRANVEERRASRVAWLDSFASDPVGPKLATVRAIDLEFNEPLDSYWPSTDLIWPESDSDEQVTELERWRFGEGVEWIWILTGLMS